MPRCPPPAPDKLDTGFAQSPEIYGSQVSPPLLLSSRDNRRSGLEDTDTINSSCTLRRRRAGGKSKKPSASKECSSNPREAEQPKSTATKKTPETESLTSLELEALEGIHKLTGTESKNSLKRVASMLCLPRFTFDITGPYELLQQIMLRLSLWRELSNAFMVRLEQEKQEEHGKKQEAKRILKILVANSGVAMEVKMLLLSTNFAEVSTSHIYCDGWIDIQSEWKQRELVCHYPRQDFGSHLIYTQNPGFPM
jgi:hypothetical protein